MNRSPTIAALALLVSGAAAAAAGGPVTNNMRSTAATASSPLLRLTATASAAGTFDGTYAGKVTNVKQARACGSQDSWNGIFVVDSGKFKTNIGTFLLSGDVRPDGSFEASLALGRSSTLHLTGKIDGITMHAAGVSSLCEWNMDMKKSAS